MTESITGVALLLKRCIQKQCISCSVLLLGTLGVIREPYHIFSFTLLPPIFFMAHLEQMHPYKFSKSLKDNFLKWWLWFIL